MNYDSNLICKFSFSSISLNISGDCVFKFNIFEEKVIWHCCCQMTLKYPQLLRPTYYPEIDALNISDEEKLRLDKAAYMNTRNYMSEDNLDRLDYKLSIEDLELLNSIRVVEKKYNFRCEDCGDLCVTISESDLEKYKRVFYLEELGNSRQTNKIKNLMNYMGKVLLYFSMLHGMWFWLWNYKSKNLRWLRDAY